MKILVLQIYWPLEIFKIPQNILKNQALRTL